jgi:hypothetical protein
MARWGGLPRSILLPCLESEVAHVVAALRVFVLSSCRQLDMQPTQVE